MPGQVRAHLAQPRGIEECTACRRAECTALQSAQPCHVQRGNVHSRVHSPGSISLQSAQPCHVQRGNVHSRVHSPGSISLQSAQPCHVQRGNVHSRCAQLMWATFASGLQRVAKRLLRGGPGRSAQPCQSAQPCDVQRGRVHSRVHSRCAQLICERLQNLVGIMQIVI